ncbi:MerR family transcriptional regulator [Ramlibacter sp. XY19]|uniref:MerR family transcriptional regulator n=1 Tax=Ramlibacter paludis TaxID=2908000 RepID=UPI0023DA1F30|nr:adenylate/guanylate cyclase domain-containing protein [Ramlibacter paludis]MCG2593586.1 MerR family transcriptional regulator [Ramlibacter paludis]
MLTSKEIIERTGISRATLNNYIASGLVPRPQVLPPGPQDGAAPRIGYFPDDTIARVESIQRLKQQGWSITRIAEHFAAHPPVAAPSVAAAPVPAPAQQAEIPAAAARVAAPAPAPGVEADPTLRMWLANARHPAYLVNDAFRLVWRNEAARNDPATANATLATSIFATLLQLDAAAGRDALLRLHLAIARARSAAPADLFRGLDAQQAARLEALYRNVGQADDALVAQVQLPAAGGQPARLAYAVQFREGVLFAYAPADAGTARTEAQAPAAPVLTPVAIVVTSLQDAAGLWVKLTAQEYFELLNEVGVELDRIFRQNHGQPGRAAGEVLVCYFLPQGDGGSYFWNALAAAQQTRAAMRQVSRRWQARKSWDVELCMNIGIDEGQEWMGTLGSQGAGELRVLGDAAERAAQMSRASRMGAVLLTRSLVGKLAVADRQRLTYGVRRLDGSDSPLLFTFARLADLAAPTTVPAPVADLAVAELLDLNFPNTNTGPGSAG